MPKKVRKGWVAPIDPEMGYTTDNGKKPTAIYVHGDIYWRAYLAHAGIDDGEVFEVPGNTDFLRDLAAAIKAYADECDKLRGI